MKAKKIRSRSMSDVARDLIRSTKTVEDIDKELEELARTWTTLMGMREIAAKALGVTKQPPTLPSSVITQRRHAPYPSEPVGDLEVREGSRPYIVHKILTDAGRPISYRELRERFAETELGKQMGTDDKPYYSGIQALKMKGHCVVYRGHITTPDALKKFKADVAAGRVADIEEMPRFTSLWAEEITRYLKLREDWVSSKEVADYLAALPQFQHVKNTYARTCVVLTNMKRRRGLVEKEGQGKGTRWRMSAAPGEGEKVRAAEASPSAARH